MFRRSGDERGGGLFPEGGPTPILIVEDDEGLALLMEESLQGLSLECARAATGGETLQWFDSQRSGLLLLDYSLPDMTGLEVLSRLEKVGMRPPFIVTTGVGDEKLAVEMMKRGARDYLVKDKEFLAALPATVARVLRELRGEEELRRVREDLERSRALYQTMVKAATGISFILTGNEGGESRIREFSPGAEALFGYRREELLGMRVQELYSPEEFSLVERFFQEKAGRGERLEGEATLLGRGGRTFPALFSVHPLTEKKGEVYGYLFVALDISERKEAETRLRRSLEEKDLLLKEIHHRVKNNLQVIVSLLSLQAGQVKDPALKSSFNETRNRVFSMALVHETLYRSKDLGKIDLGLYLREFTKRIFTTYGTRNAEVHIEGEGVYLNIDTAIPCSLIVNELMTNSIRYAFPEKEQGNLFLKFRAGEEVDLIVGDDGVGLPEGFNWRESTSLGLQLVVSLVKQIDGTIEKEEGKGTVFHIRFPLN